MYREQIDRYFDLHKDEIVENIKRLVRIPSIARPDLAQEGAPFGPVCRQTVDEAGKIAAELGLKSRIVDGYVIEIDMNDKTPEVGILAHLDVVPEGDGWETDPYDPQVRDGYIFGRGADDNKGPAVISLYAMKAAMEINPALAKGCRTILGSAEEIGSPDLKYYRKHNECPPKTFSPDASYPVINIEKGSYGPFFGASWANETGARVLEITGGTVGNVVPKRAAAKVAEVALADVQAACDAVTAATGVTFAVTEENGAVRIAAEGMDAHASRPHLGNNALTALLQALNSLPLAPNTSRNCLASLVKLFPHGDWDGAAIGVKMQDELSGALTLNFSICNWTETGFKARFDSRVPICGNEQNMKAVVDAALAAEGMPTLQDKPMKAPHHTPADSPFVQTLLKVYEEYSGLKGECLAIGGGTYAHGIPGAVAFGCSFPGDPSSNIHSSNERASIDRLITSAKIFTAIILQECR